MEEIPQTTLTQRRNELSSGAKKLTKEKLEHTDSPNDRAAIIRVIIWIAVVVFIGIGSALLFTSLLNKNTNNTQNSGTNPVAQTPDSFTTDNTVTNPVATTPTTPTPTVTPTTTPTPPTAPTPPTTGQTDSMGNTYVTSLDSYETTNRALAAQATGNTINLAKFKYFQSNTEFNYIFYNVTSTVSTIDPAISVYYDASNNLIVQFNNINRDSVTEPGNKTTRTFTGVTGISGDATANTGAISTYKFLMTTKYPAKVTIDKTNSQIIIQVKNK